MLYAPPALGYGPEGAGPIPPNSVLVFKVKLVGMLSAD
jgi:peptidylprolyl isomerase/FKBP-type peptidyl-prolyl cis-trans isomerase FklB